MLTLAAIDRLIDQYEHDGSHDAALAVLVRDLALSDDNAINVLLPLVKERVDHRRRRVVASVERRAIRRPRSDGDAYDVVLARKELLEQSIALGDGRFVTWRDATRADFAQRIDLLMVNLRGLTRSVSRYQQALNVLDAYQVDTLGALEELGVDLATLDLDVELDAPLDTDVAAGEGSVV